MIPIPILRLTPVIVEPLRAISPAFKSPGASERARAKDHGLGVTPADFLALLMPDRSSVKPMGQ